MKFFYAAVLFLLLSGCALLNDFRVSVGLISPYKAAEDAFKRGDVMEARSRLVSIPKSDPDYAKSQKFLSTKVEPARLKLLRYYVNKGKKEEKKHHWSQAEEAYKTAATLSRNPKLLLRYQRKVSLKARELRFRKLYKQRLKEDLAWLKWKSEYKIPESKSLLEYDTSLVLAKEDFEEVLEYRVDHALWLADRHEQMERPELAWLYADSYLRFKPDSEKAKQLKRDMEKLFPDTFKKGVRVQKVKQLIKPKYHSIKKKDVQTFIKKKQWVKARRAALALRRQGSPAADKLLKIIEQKTTTLAASAYERGNIAFRQEQIDKAVAFWKEAVRLMPDEQLYVDSLRRGQKIQERLAALKREESQAEKESKTEK